MPTTTTNGNPSTASELIDAVRQTVEKLEAELGQQRLEIDRLRAERDEYRKLFVAHAIRIFGGPEAWDDFNERDYTLTIDDLLAVVNSK